MIPLDHVSQVAIIARFMRIFNSERIAVVIRNARKLENILAFGQVVPYNILFQNILQNVGNLYEPCGDVLSNKMTAGITRINYYRS